MNIVEQATEVGRRAWEAGTATEWLSQYPKRTHETYRQVLEDFTALMGIDPQDADQGHMLAYARALDHQASATVHKKLAALNSYFTWSIKRGIRNDNPMVAIRMPKVDNLRTIEYLTGERVEEVMRSFKHTKKDLRDRALLAVLLHGLRLAEVVSLNVEDYREGNLWVTGKGNKTRIVPLDGSAQPFLKEYLGRRRSGPLFVSLYRPGGRIERRIIQRIVKERTGLHPHALRHTCGTLMMRATKNLAAVQDMLGHASPVTTRIYAKLDTSDLRSAVEMSGLLGG
jgi:site-specific recombinase XerD